MGSLGVGGWVLDFFGGGCHGSLCLILMGMGRGLGKDGAGMIVRVGFHGAELGRRSNYTICWDLLLGGGGR